MDELETMFGFNPNNVIQGSEEWHKMKMGVISASKAKDIVSKASSMGKRTYVSDLVAQVATGFKDSISAKALEWGINHEDAARAAYDFQRGIQTIEVPFIYGHNTLRYGISPDGLLARGDDVFMGAEIKCPYNPVNFIKFACYDDIKKEHELQCQFSMWVTGLEKWDYVNYDPRMKNKQLHSYTYERNQIKMDLFETCVNEIIYAMDENLKMLGLEFGDQWRV